MYATVKPPRVGRCSGPVLLLARAGCLDRNTQRAEQHLAGPARAPVVGPLEVDEVLDEFVGRSAVFEKRDRPAPGRLPAGYHGGGTMRIKLNRFMVDDQNSLKFYREISRRPEEARPPVGEYRWITFVSPELRISGSRTRIAGRLSTPPRMKPLLVARRDENTVGSA